MEEADILHDLFCYNVREHCGYICGQLLMISTVLSAILTVVARSLDGLGGLV